MAVTGGVSHIPMKHHAPHRHQCLKAGCGTRWTCTTAGCVLPPVISACPQCDPQAYQASGGLLTKRHMSVDTEAGQGG